MGKELFHLGLNTLHKRQQLYSFSDDALGGYLHEMWCFISIYEVCIVHSSEGLELKSFLLCVCGHYLPLCPTGYLLVSGFVSLAVCYHLGPITSRRTLNVATWALQAVGMVLACHGVTYTPVSWILLAVLLGFKILPLLFALILAVWRCSLLH